MFLEPQGTRRGWTRFGKVQRAVAEALALEQYERYDAHRRMLEAADVDELRSGVKALKPKN